MKRVWLALGFAGAFAVAPVAVAHELECVKVVNGETLLEVESFPTTLTYSLTVRNIHPTLPSDVLSATDALLESLGFNDFDDAPFTLLVNAERTETFDVVLDDLQDCEAIAARDGTVDTTIFNEFAVTWDEGVDVCSARVECVPPEPRPGDITGRMTGGGSVFGTGRDRVTHGFQLRCDADDPRQNLQVNWQGNRFHLLDLTTASCTDTALDEEQPRAGFDTFTGTGTGRYNGVEGATIEFIFTDDGEPGTDDRARIVIRDETGDIVLEVDGTLRFGNHQAHP